MIYAAAFVVGLVGVKVLAVAIESAAAEHRDHSSPSMHHLSRLFWWSGMFGLVALLCLTLLPAGATW